MSLWSVGRKKATGGGFKCDLHMIPHAGLILADGWAAMASRPFGKGPPYSLTLVCAYR